MSQHDEPDLEIRHEEFTRRVMPKQKPGRSKQDYGTPASFLTAVKYLLGIREFDIDLAATHVNRVAPSYFGPEDEEFPAFTSARKGTNALIQPTWRVGNGWNWLNPPFSRIEPWVRKAAQQYREHGAHTAVLVPAGVGANWHRDWAHNVAQVLFINGRLTFEGELLPYPKDCMLLLYGRPSGYWVWDWKRLIEGLA